MQSSSFMALNYSTMGSEARGKSGCRPASFTWPSVTERELIREAGSVDKGGDTRAKGQKESNVTTEILFFHEFLKT